MGIFTRIPEDTFDSLQLDAGVLLKTFDPNKESYDVETDINANLITATTGGISVSCTATYSDFGEDVDNCPNNMMELKHLDGWDCTMSFTMISMSADGIKLALGAADKSEDGKKVTVRKSLKTDLTDFSTIWWVGDTAKGGAVAICLKNALSTSGFSLQTSKNAKGQVSVTLTGHVSIEKQDEMPMEFYLAEKVTESEAV